MSSRYVETMLNHVRSAARSTAVGIRRQSQQLWQHQVSNLPSNHLLEMVRGPLRTAGTPDPDSVFTILDENALYVDLLGAVDVLAGAELRRYYHKRLCATPVVAWCLLDACVHTCSALLLLNPVEGCGYEVRALYVQQHQLLCQPYVHESLLLALVAFADRRCVELRIPSACLLPLTAMLLSLALFMQENDGGLVRLPLSELVLSQTLFSAASRQLQSALRTLLRASEAQDGKSPVDPPGTAAARPS